MRFAWFDMWFTDWGNHFTMYEGCEDCYTYRAIKQCAPKDSVYMRKQTSWRGQIRVQAKGRLFGDEWKTLPLRLIEHTAEQIRQQDHLSTLSKAGF